MDPGSVSRDIRCIVDVDCSNGQFESWKRNEGNTAQAAAAIKLNRVPERHGGVEDPGPVAVQRNLPGPANVAHLHHPLLADGLPPGDVVRVLDAYQPRGRMVLKHLVVGP